MFVLPVGSLTRPGTRHALAGGVRCYKLGSGSRAASQGTPCVMTTCVPGLRWGGYPTPPTVYGYSHTSLGSGGVGDFPWCHFHSCRVVPVAPKEEGQEGHREQELRSGARVQLRDPWGGSFWAIGRVRPPIHPSTISTPANLEVEVHVWPYDPAVCHTCEPKKSPCITPFGHR